MNKVLKILVLLPAILFLVTGLRWLVAPAGVAPMFGLTLDQGVGLSSQVGDMTGFFLTLGSCMLIALISGRRSWYYPAIMLLSITAVGRILAWLVHDATLALDLIAPEVIVSIILLVASRRLPEEA
jgi:energy-converting hydrogenase Eha subunit E